MIELSSFRLDLPKYLLELLFSIEESFFVALLIALERGSLRGELLRRSWTLLGVVDWRLKSMGNGAFMLLGV